MDLPSGEKSTQPRISAAITAKLLKRMQEESYQASFSKFVEGILVRFNEGKLANREDIKNEIREEIFAELAAEGIIIPPQARAKDERRRKAS